MDAGKIRGNYSSAYKLSRSTINNKAVRRERRSIEQKELRHGEVNKRRNLYDLSPLQEGDATLTQDKNYKDKTPLKPKTDDRLKKGFDRLEQLKKWKQERERKRKQDDEESRKKNPVFRVSKAVAHGDTRLFGKTDTKKHPVRPKPPPVSTVSKPSSQKVPTAHIKPTAQSKSSHTSTAGKQHTERPSRRNTESQAAGKQRPTTATRSSSRGAKTESVVKDKPSKKEKAHVPKQSAQSTRTLRSARQATVPAEPTSTRTRQTAKEKAAESKFKAATVPKPVFEPEERPASSPDLNFSRVTTRGDISVLPADSFAQTTDFGFNASSFVFRPLSPASAAGFLCPNPDTSSCTSFLETNPKRSSTPKKKKNKERLGSEAAANKTSLSQTDLNMTQDVTQMNNTATEQNDKTVVASPDVTNKSVRRSRRSIKPVEIEADTVKEASVQSPCVSADSENKPTPRRNTRRSVSSAAAEKTENVTQPEEKPKSTRKGSRRHSLMSANEEVDDSSKSDKDIEKPRHSSRRRSVASSSDSDSKGSPKVENASPVRRRRSLRRSLMSVDSDSENAVERKTPSDRRKSRRSVAVAYEPEAIQEVPEDSDSSQGSSDVFEETENKENAGPVDEIDTSQKKKLSDSGVDLALSTETTPTTQKKNKRSRNKSFGGFRLPAADSVVLSAKRKPRRKTLMPKSPEEWIEVLSNSPMVEMTRRKHKLGDTSLPVLNFEDVDQEEPESSVATEETEVKVTESERAQSVAVERNEVSPVAMETEEDANKENEPQAEASDKAVVQVGEVSSTQDGPLSDEGSSDTEHDVPYFRKLLCTETNRLNGLSDHWNLINDNTELTEEVHGQIRTTVGQAQLLMNQRFKQFSGLVDNCEFKLGEKETTCMDLKGFWEMIYYQVEDVDNKFAELTKLKENNWVDDKPKPVVKKVKKKVSKPSVSKPAVKSKFAAFRAHMKQKESVSCPAVPEKEEEKVFEVPGFFTVSSPVRSPKPHCEGGTPKKATPSSAETDEKQNSKDALSLPGSSEILINRTPARKSYLPAVPSPLLVDTTPLPRPKRTCTQKTPVSKRIIDEVDCSDMGVGSESESKRAKITPARRSLRPRKSVNFSDTVSVGILSSPTVEGSDEDFARLLQPMTSEEQTETKVDAGLDDSFSKYLQPLSTLDTSLAKDETPKQSRSRRSSLKGCRSTERRRSRQRSVHFGSPSVQDSAHTKLPHTPYNKDSLVKQKRVSRRSQQMDDDIFSIDNIDNDENIPPPSFRSPRPSLLGTPPDMKRNPAKVSSYVPTGTLISFTP